MNSASAVPRSSAEVLLARFQSQPETTPLELDLSALSELARPAGMLISAALLGSLGRRTLNVTIGRGGQDSPWPERAGMAFALANRPGDTHLPFGLEDDRFNGWRQTWTPGLRHSWNSIFGVQSGSDALFPPEAIDESSWVPDLFGPGWAAFVNPHRTGPRSRGIHPIRRVLHPWLMRLVGRQPDRARLIGDLGTLVDELLSNIAEHGARKGPDDHSLAHIAVTRGTSRHLHLSFLDTGLGIVATLRPKLEETDLHYNDAGLLEALLDGTLLGWGAGRGFGLAAVRRICATQHGHLRIATGRLRIEVAPGAAAAVAREEEFDLRGTAVVATIPLART